MLKKIASDVSGLFEKKLPLFYFVNDAIKFKIQLIKRYSLLYTLNSSLDLYTKMLPSSQRHH
jgi:hypothetical protein